VRNYFFLSNRSFRIPQWLRSASWLLRVRLFGGSAQPSYSDVAQSSQKPVSGPGGSAEGLKDYFRIADQPPTKRCCTSAFERGPAIRNRSNRSLSHPLRFDNAPGLLDADQALALERPYIERDYIWRITIDIRSCSVVRSIGKDQVRNRYEAVIAE
jgi:hypothetical protein